LLLTFIAVACWAADPFIPELYPFYLQCDPLWGNDLMGGSQRPVDTLCQQGCAVTSLTMALAKRGERLDGAPLDPGTFNQWLHTHDGYLDIGGDPNNLNLTAPEQLNPSAIRFISEKEKPDIRTMQAWIRGGQPEIIAHVRDNSHFVLVIGFDRQVDTIFYVNDPFYNTTTYNYSDMSDLILYVIKPMD